MKKLDSQTQIDVAAMLLVLTHKAIVTADKWPDQAEFFVPDVEYKLGVLNRFRDAIGMDALTVEQVEGIFK